MAPSYSLLHCPPESVVSFLLYKAKPGLLSRVFAKRKLKVVSRNLPGPGFILSWESGAQQLGCQRRLLRCFLIFWIMSLKNNF